jgi:hypothetical protein
MHISLKNELKNYWYHQKVLVKSFSMNGYIVCFDNLNVFGHLPLNFEILSILILIKVAQTI